MELAEEWSRLALDHLPVGLLVINRHRKIRIFNQTLSRFLGLKSEKVLGQPLLGILDDRGPDFNILLQTLVTGKEFQNVKPQAVTTVSCSVACLVNTYPVRNRTGITVGAMAVFSPAARLQEMENAVVKAEKLAILGLMSAGMVHEIRNPLTAVGCFLQLLQKCLTGHPKEEYIPIMLTELNRANRLISEFLQFAKPGYSRRTSCSIGETIKNVLMLVESEALSRKLEIKLDLDVDMPNIFVDGEQLKQVFINIMKNSFDALSEGGKIFVQTSWNELDGFAQVSFRDTGVGIDKDTIANMFNPFFTTKESGTGLGMFTSKKIIDNHGGRIDIQSEPGKGTTVVVLLPAVQ
ncbi:MAG: ATP-binding protein [Desulfotomaculaceae bacterium]|nr:ATP-binding protein [Desulfotomaculaceae bacterium]